MRNVLFAVIASMICACGDESDKPTTPEPTEGKVTVNAVGVEGYTNHVLLVFVSPTNQPFNPYGVVCSWITSDNYSMSDAVVQTVATGGNGPCDPTNTDMVLDNGDYGIGFYIFVPGEQTPKKSSNTTFTLYGDTTVDAPAFATWN